MKVGFRRLVLGAIACAAIARSALPQRPASKSPEAAGVSSEQLQRITAWMKEQTASGRFAGAVVLIARHGQVVAFESAGMADVERKVPMRTDAIFRLASMTKPIVSVGVMMLYEEGRLGLDDPVAKYLPEFSRLRVYQADGPPIPPRRPMTIRDLLRHTSGLTYGAFGETPVDSMYRRQAILMGNLDAMVRKLAAIPLLHEPGEQWEYSVSTDVLGRVIEVVAKQPLDAFLTERILKPLGMIDTDFYVPSERLSRLAASYEVSPDGSLRPVKDPRDQRPSFLSGGGGLVSTAADYLRFSQMLLNHGAIGNVRLLKPATIDSMTVNQIPARAMPLSATLETLDAFVQGYGFGLGFRVLVDVPNAGGVGSERSFGWAGARSTFVWIDPKKDLIALLMTQVTPWRYYPMDKEFERLLYAALLN